MVTALHRMAKIRDGSGLVDHNIFRQVVEFVHDRVRVGSTPRHIANTIWRCARLAHKSTPLIEDGLLAVMVPDAATLFCP